MNPIASYSPSLQHPLPSLFQPPLIEMDSIKKQFIMRYDLCAGLKDGDWESMTLQEKKALTRYFISKKPCDTLQSKLINDVTKAVRNIAKKLDYKKASKLSVMINSGISYGMEKNTIKMNYEQACNLIGWNSPEQQNQASGNIAHEIGHKAKNHVKKAQDYEKLNPNYYQASEFMKNQEKEADLFTLKVPHFARGLLDDMKITIEICSKLGEDENCREVYQDSDTHPSELKRADYLTKALCEQYPQFNQDICP